MNDTANKLDELLDTLDGQMNGSVKQTGGGDAIDQILASRGRTTKTRSLRENEVMQKFRQELADGLIRADTVQRVLGLIDVAVKAIK